LLVLVYHFTMGIAATGPIGKAVLRVAGVGWCGVDLFFVLSGFLITGILLDGRESAHRFRNFYARRSLRIFPLYYVVLLVVGLVWTCTDRSIGGFEGVEEAAPWLWFYGTNILVALRGGWFPLSHFWSLAVEEHFYLFWPAVVFGLRRRGSLRICLAMIVLAPAVRLFLVMNDAVLAAYCLTVCRMDALAMGGLIAILSRSPGGIAALVRPARRLLWGAGVVVLALFGLRRGLAFHDPLVQTLGYTVLDACFAAAIALIVAGGGSSLMTRAGWLKSLGKYSYGLYVYNSIFILIGEGQGLQVRLGERLGSSLWGGVAYGLLGAVVSLLVSWLSWHLVEKRVLAFKKCFPSGTGSHREPRNDASVLAVERAEGMSAGRAGTVRVSVRVDV
jgi:peptidoglycan/LPS O-acetylase OafA/YrhL